MNYQGCAVGLLLLLTTVPALAAESELLKTPRDKISYAAGVEVARNFRRQDVPFSPEVLLKGVQDELAGQGLLISETERRTIMRDMQGEVNVKMAQKRQRATVENRLKEEEFLAANKAKEAVVTLPSGLQYQVIKPGDGKVPTEDDTVECNYTANHLDGTVLDESDPGKPLVMKIGKLIPGWKEAMKIMPQGSIWQIYVPARLAYGEQGAGYDIGPNEMLIFKVELLSVK